MGAKATSSPLLNTAQTIRILRTNTRFSHVYIYLSFLFSPPALYINTTWLQHLLILYFLLMAAESLF